ncbi:MAG: hypothetical protein K8S97_01105 [Anaerolineae bacterium]|nr:hypothetical protein [Anaerolineae bacterium]
MDIHDMDMLSDDDLWDIVEQGVADADRARYQELFRWDATDELSPAEQAELESLGALIDGWMARRDTALDELARRGFDVSGYAG